MADYQYKSRFTRNEIDERLERAGNVSNPNLLDNWYFGNPVNQRGQNEYTNIGSYSYGIDRWICRGIALSDTGITFTENGSFMDQILELAKKVALSGKAVTASVLLDSGELVYGTLQYESSVSEQKFFATGNIQLVLLANGIIRLYSIGNYTAVAVKLELGSQQTLAHQDADGKWVLNEIPDYGEQLRRCQYYFRFFGEDIEIPCSNNGAGSYMEGTLPLTMRSGSGAISYGNSNLFFGNGTYYSVTNASVTSNGGRVKIGVNINGQITSNQQATLYLTNCSIVFDL